MDSFNPELQRKDTESAIKCEIAELLTQLRGFKFVTTLVLVFKKVESKDKKKHDNFYSSAKAEIIINESDIGNVCKSIYTATWSSIFTRPNITYLQMKRQVKSENSFMFKCY